MNSTLKLRFIACQLISAGIISVCCQSAHAQSFFTENFGYPAGELGGNVNPSSGNAWTGGNADLSVATSQLTYPGLLEPSGGELVYTAGGGVSTINQFTSQTSGSVYYSFLIDGTALPTGNNYFTALNPGTTTPGGGSDAMSTYVGVSSTTGDYKIGVRTSGGGSGAAYDSAALALGTTYFVVEELAFGSTSVASIWVDPVPGSSQGAADTTQSTTTSLSTGVDDVGFKSSSGSSQGNFLISDLEIGTTWADVTPSVPEPSTFVFLGGSLLAAWKLRRQTRA
jgi:hypothetical protein